MRFFILAILLIGLFSCGNEEEKRLEYAKKYLASRTDITPEARDAILHGHVIIGMTPEEAEAAAGQYSFLILFRDPKWPKDADPVDVINAQHQQPDSSVIQLDFIDRAQSSDSKSTVFSVCIVKGRVSRIVRDGHGCEKEMLDVQNQLAAP